MDTDALTPIYLDTVMNGLAMNSAWPAPTIRRRVLNQDGEGVVADSGCAALTPVQEVRAVVTAPCPGWYWTIHTSTSNSQSPTTTSKPTQVSSADSVYGSGTLWVCHSSFSGCSWLRDRTIRRSRWCRSGPASEITSPTIARTASRTPWSA